MKKLTFLIVAAMTAVSAFAGTVITQAQLPAAARSFMSKHFAGEKIKKIEKDQGHRGLEYEVDLVSGAELEFKEDGTWKKVDAAPGKTVPAAIIPSGIASYVKKNCGGQGIVEISFKRGGYEVKLANGSKLYLTKEGKTYTPTRGGGGRPKNK